MSKSYERQCHMFIELTMNEITKRLTWSLSESRQEIPDMDKELLRIHAARTYHILYERPANYKGVAWEVVRSRKNADGTITQRLRPLYEVDVRTPEIAAEGKESAA